MKATLYKLKEGYVLAYDNLTRESFIESWLSMGKSIICHGGKTRRVLTKSPDFSLLSEEDAKRIGWFDVEKIFPIRVLSEKGNKDAYEKYRHDIFNLRSGFQKALELTADRRFTEDDMKKALMSLPTYLNEGLEKHNWIIDKIKSLSQPKSWEVEVEEVNGAYKVLSIV